MFPVIAGLMRHPPAGVGAIYLAPIKALLNNQEVRLGDYTQMVGLDRFVWHGDASQSAKARFIKQPCTDYTTELVQVDNLRPPKSGDGLVELGLAGSEPTRRLACV